MARAELPTVAAMSGVSDQLVVPVGDPGRAVAVTATLGRAALTCDEARRVLEDVALGGVVTVQSWRGEAATAFRERCRPLAVRLAELERTCSVAAELVSRWAATAGPARDTMLRVRAEVQGVLPATPIGQDVALASALAAFGAARQTYDEATRTAAWGLHGVRDEVTDRSLTIGDQAVGLVATAWREGVVAPLAGAYAQARAIWGLTGEGLVDQDAFRRNVGAVPAQAADGFRTLEQVLADPLPVAVATAGALVGWPEFERGRWGAGVGTLAAVAVPGPKGERLAKGLEAATAVRLQPLDRLLTKVDLSTNELAGHTLERHVGADDAFLVDRLELGTLMPDGTRGYRPPSASRFHDEATAQRVVDQVLHENEATIRRWATTGPAYLRLERDFGAESLGTVCRLVDGSPVFEEGRVARLSLTRTSDGQVFLETAYVETSLSTGKATAP